MKQTIAIGTIIENLNHVGVEYVSYYDRKKHEINAYLPDDRHNQFDRKTCIQLPYEEHLYSFGEVLDAFSDEVQREMNISLDLPYKGVVRYLKETGFYDWFRDFQNQIIKENFLKWCKEHNVPVSDEAD